MNMFAFKHTSNVVQTSLITILGVTCMLGPGLLASNVTDRPRQDLSVVPCHDEWDSSPCVCYGLSSNKVPTTMRCSEIASQEQMKNIFNKMKQPLQLQQFSLSLSDLKMLPAGVFGKVTFERISLFKTSIEKLEPGVFQGMEETLIEVNFMENKIKKIDFLSGMQALKVVVIWDEPCEEIADSALANLPRLSFVFLHLCAVRIIGNYAFANTTGSISFWYNKVKVTKIGDYAFSNSVGGRRFIKLMNVTDSTFSMKTFVGSSFKMLRIKGLTTLKEDVFSPVLNNPQRGYCRFPGTLKCDESMDWIAANNATRRAFRFECEDGKTLEENIKRRQTIS